MLWPQDPGRQEVSWEVARDLRCKLRGSVDVPDGWYRDKLCDPSGLHKEGQNRNLEGLVAGGDGGNCAAEKRG